MDRGSIFASIDSPSRRSDRLPVGKEKIYGMVDEVRWGSPPSSLTVGGSPSYPRSIDEGP